MSEITEDLIDRFQARNNQHQHEKNEEKYFFASVLQAYWRSRLVRVVTKTQKKIWVAGDRVDALWKDESRKWKLATVQKYNQDIVKVTFDGYDDVKELPHRRVREPEPYKLVKKYLKSVEKKKIPWRPDTLPSSTKIARSLLSKLTEDNYEKIFPQFLELEMNDTLIDSMFERAVLETYFCPIYALLFSHFHQHFLTLCEEVVGESTRNELPMNTKKTVDFQEKLLNRVHKEFEIPKGNHQRRLGFFVFLGQLCIRDILHDDYIIQIIGELLPTFTVKTNTGGNGTDLSDGHELVPPVGTRRSGDEDTTEETTNNIEYACILLGAIGKKFDATVEGRAQMDIYTRTFQAWSMDKTKVPCMRIRFKILDLLEERLSGWHIKA